MKNLKKNKKCGRHFAGCHVIVNEDIKQNVLTEKEEAVKIDSKENLIRLMSEYQNLVFSVCLKLTGDYFVSEDITQETFLAAYRHWNEFDGKNEKAWLCRIAGNKCIDWKRRAVRKEEATEEEVLMEQPSEEREPLQEILCREVTQKLAESCKSLSPPYNETAESYFLKGLTAKEIAAESGVGLKTVQTRIYRARQMLQKTIRKEELVS